MHGQQVVATKLAANESHTIRLKVPYHKTMYIDDLIRGRVRLSTFRCVLGLSHLNVMVHHKVTWDVDSCMGGDFIILRSNGMPVYNFCVAGELSGGGFGRSNI